MGAIHSTKIPTGPTGKRGPPQKVDPFFRNFSGWTEPIHWVLDRNFRKVWLNGSRPRTTSKGGPVFSKLFLLDRTFPLSFGPKFPEILVEWIAPIVLPDQFQTVAAVLASDWCQKTCVFLAPQEWRRFQAFQQLNTFKKAFFNGQWFWDRFSLFTRSGPHTAWKERELQQFIDS